MTANKFKKPNKKDKKQSNKPSNLDNNTFKQEILALGGDDDDFKLLNGVESDEEATFDNVDNNDPNLLKDLKDLYKSLDFNSVQPVEREEDEEQDENDEESAASEEENANGSVDGNDSEIANEEDSEEEDEEDDEEDREEDANDIDPLSEIDPEGPFAQIPQWFLQPLPELKKSKPNPNSQSSTDGRIQHANKLLEDLPKSAQSSSAVSSSDKKFLDQMLKSGTLNDRVSALALLIAESPIHAISSLEALKNMASKPKREEALRAMKALVDWLAGPHGVKDKHLTFWAFENWLKAYFFEVLQLLESFTHDTLTFVKQQAIMLIFQLLKDKPEQEHNLLRLLINKLGDPSRQVASKASNQLLVILQAHPAMKGIISREVGDLIFRPHISESAKYYAIITLNQIMFTKADTGVANKLIEIYFNCFKDFLREEEAYVKKTKEDAKNAKKNKKQHGKNDKKDKKGKKEEAEEDPEMIEEKKSKMIAGILAGIHRAMPYANIEEKIFDNYMDTLFRITHTGTFNIAIQALQLINQVTIIKETISDRFYRTLYESLLDQRLSTSSKQSMYLNLLFSAVKRDPSNARVAAFVKRILQMLLGQSPSFICGAFYHLNGLLSSHPSLRAMLDDGEENDAGGVASTSYDKFKRDPQYSNAQHSCLWELLPFTNHYHPSVAIQAKQILNGEVVRTSADLNLNTLMHFLDRFVYKNPKKDIKPKGASLMQPIAASDRSQTVANVKGATRELMVNSSEFRKKKEENVAPDMLFFHKFFNQRNKRLEEKAAKRDKRKKGSDDEDEESADDEPDQGEDVDLDKDDDDDDVAEDGSEMDEDEVWKAMQASMPGQEDDDIEESDEDDVDPALMDDSEEEAEGEGEPEPTADDEEEEEEDDDDDDEGGLEGLVDDEDDLLSVDEMESEAGDESEAGEEESLGKRKRDDKDAKKAAKKAKKALPTFASADDYAHFSPAPSGVPYYYNASLKKSTYTRPLPAPEVNVQAAPPPPAPLQETPPVQTQGKKTKKEKPSKKTPIEGTAWMRITTNFGNVFYTNKDRKESVWEVPREIEDQVRQLEEEENSDPRDKKRKRVPQTDPGDSGWIDVEPAKKAKEEDDDADYAAAAKAAMEEERQHSKNIMLAEQAEQREAEEERRRAYEEKKAAEAEANYDHEEAKALFKSMLMEYDINPLIPWDMALPTFVNDSRYTSLRNTEDRQDTFDEYCREKSMMTKKNAVTVDPVITYRELLRTEVTSTRTRFEDFRRDFKKDRRFFGYGRDDKEREKVFKSWLRELGEAKRKEAQKAEEAFKKLLKDTSEITKETDYKEIKPLLSSHSAYRKLQSGSTKEALFNAYKRELAGEQPESSTPKEEPQPVKEEPPKKLDKAARAEASIKAREENYRKEREKIDKQAQASKSALVGDESEREYRTLLIDAVRSHRTRWRDVEHELAKDRRFNVNISDRRKRDLFKEHVDSVYNKRLKGVRDLFEKEFNSLDDKFEDVYDKIKDELPIKVFDASGKELWRVYEDWQGDKFKQAIKEFKELLNESSFVGYWGRVKKGEEGQTKDAEMVFKEDEEEAEEENDEGVFGGGNKDIKKLAQQSATTHLALKGKDLVGSARTGSGKTLSYLVPMLESLYKDKWSNTDGLGALVVAPTRELALQIFKVLHSIGNHHSFSAGLLIGGKNVQQEKTRLNRMNILIATPGRLLQHMDETYGFNADNLKLLILDEADRILDLGFQKTIQAILEQLPPTHTRQNLLFSATISPSVASLAKLSLNNPSYVQIGGDNGEDPTPKNLAQFYSVIPLDRKLDVLFGFIKTHLKNKVLVFASSCKQVRHIYETFSHLRPGTSLMHLHGKLKQTKRNATLTKFSQASHAVLFATDIAARGLDIPAVDWVVQLDIPEDADTYIHRVGRTARYNSKGSSLMLVEPSEREGILNNMKIKHIEPKLLKIKEKLMQPISNALQAHAFQDTEIKYLAQKAFVSYIRSVYLQKDKETFNVAKLPVEKYASSLGLPGVPKVKFMAAEKAKARKNEKNAKKEESSEAEDGSDSEDNSSDPETSNNQQSKPGVRTKYDRLFERKNQGQLSEHYNALIDRNDGSDEDDFITLKRRDHDLEGDGSDLEDAAGNLSKRKLKAGQSKKAVAGKSEPGHKLRFDDDGQAHEIYELQKGEDVDVEEEKKKFIEEQNEKLKQADIENKRQAKEKRDEKKRKRRERERDDYDDEDDEGAGEAVIGGDDLDDGYVSPEFDLPPSGSEDESESESESEEPSHKKNNLLDSPSISTRSPKREKRRIDKSISRPLNRPEVFNNQSNVDKVLDSAILRNTNENYQRLEQEQQRLNEIAFEKSKQARIEQEKFKQERLNAARKREEARLLREEAARQEAQRVEDERRARDQHERELAAKRRRETLKRRETERLSREKIEAELKLTKEREAKEKAQKLEQERQSREIEASRRREEAAKRREEIKLARQAKEEEAARVEAERIAKEKEAEAKRRDELRIKRERERQAKEAEAAQLAKERQEEEARKIKEKAEYEARIAKEKELEQARLTIERQENEARIAREKAAEEARLAEERKQREEEAARVAKEREEQQRRDEADRLAKEKEEKAARLAKEREEEEARIAKQREEEAARLAKQKEEASRLAQQKKEEAVQIAKQREEEATRLAKEKEEVTRLAQQKEAARIAKQREEETIRLAKQKEEATRLAQQKREEAARIAKQKEEAAVRLTKRKEEEAALLAKQREEKALQRTKEREQKQREAKERAKQEQERLLQEEAEKAAHVAKEREEQVKRVKDREAKQREHAERLHREELAAIAAKKELEARDKATREEQHRLRERAKREEEQAKRRDLQRKKQQQDEERAETHKKRQAKVAAQKAKEVALAREKAEAAEDAAREEEYRIAREELEREEVIAQLGILVDESDGNDSGTRSRRPIREKQINRHETSAQTSKTTVDQKGKRKASTQAEPNKDDLFARRQRDAQRSQNKTTIPIAFNFATGGPRARKTKSPIKKSYQSPYLNKNIRHRRIIPTQSTSSPLRVDGKTARERQRDYADSLKRGAPAISNPSPSKRRKRNAAFPSPTKSHRLESIRTMEEQREKLRRSMTPNNLITNIELKTFNFQSDERHQLHSERFKNRVKQWRQFEKDQREFHSSDMPNFSELHEKSKRNFENRKRMAREKMTNTQPSVINLSTEGRSKTTFHSYLEERERLRNQHREQQAEEKRQREVEEDKEYRRQLDQLAKERVHPNPFH
ncbi:CBF-domain-containing protein [Wallemia mellicola]|nr:CBF-domain-containing protein [Wallemia mellicola]